MDNEFKGFMGMGCLMMIVAGVVNILFWGGLIWLVFFLLDKYGVIG